MSEDFVNIIASSSKGNAVIYGKQILVDCGVPFKKIEPFLKDIELVLLTHLHEDHFNIATIKKMIFEKPTLRFAGGWWICEAISNYVNSDNIDHLTSLTQYGYADYTVAPVVLYHDVENFGYRIEIDGKKIFHATDTGHLDGITAKCCDYYCLEHNYDEETINQIIQEKEARGEFAHERGAVNSHLSYQQAQAFYFNNKKETSKIIRLHERN